ncbi:2-oxoacid:acceptor oxidoreductase family protein [Anaerosinus gibii]|uniref:2-oxoacid:acceptor oxidoreductase family protein n=1 Tax=Selenobaculum gibii TaxID=3054208 RepID=A0A9Y2AKR2_9FIRM|nr:2-oxoacid:acceptor oxidoreductase family protein [Selenobaculum gbiensis]WIW71996.1 2-oxoacid:acceptor oxidoreductase family protein [Selenobaculum gbiensis]
MMKQIRLSGSGGQGVITAAIIFAEGAVVEGKQAVQSQSYGPEARGGASKAEVIISNSFIYHPKVTHPDIVLAMTQKAADKYYHDLSAEGLLVVDEELVPHVPNHPNVIKVPITRLAVEGLGKSLFANVVALGLLVKLSNLVQLETIKEVVARRVPPATIEKNMEALMIGYHAID